MALVNPHGKEKKLKPLLLEGAALETEKKKASGLKKINISSRETGDLIMLGIGGFTPLTGFMTKADWKGVCAEFKMADGTFWPIPITLSATRDGNAPDGRKPKATIHWVSAAHAIMAEVRLYARLFTSMTPGGEADGGDWRTSLNAASLETLTCPVEPTLAGVKPGASACRGRPALSGVGGLSGML